MSKKKSQFLLLFTLFMGLSVGVFFNSASNTYAFPELSPDGKTCTPCHEEGTHGAGSAEQPTEQPAQQPAEQPVKQPSEEPAKQPAEQPEEQTTEPDAGDSVETSASSASPWLIVGGVIVILAVLYFLVMRKKRKDK